MKLKIHRGTQEIGGSCVEVWTENTRILFDFGLPLVEKDGKEFNFNKYKNLKTEKLIKQGVLPDIKGLYYKSDKPIDGVLISHSHQDHYGLINFINKKTNLFLGEATYKIIKLNNLFTQQRIIIKNVNFFEKQKAFQIGDFLITPYWADHAAFDAYSFLVQAEGKSIFYTGDFRNHGRKSNVFKWLIHNVPQNVDYLLMEGTTIGRVSKSFKTEREIENDLVEVFQQQNKINLIYASGQNIDRIVSVYRACLRTDKLLVVDVYVATILKALSEYAKIPFPSKKFKNLKVMFPYYTSRRLINEGNEKILYQFKYYKITQKEINNQTDKIVMLVRLSMQKDLEKINLIHGGNLIYSMWEGYLESPVTKKFIDFLINRNFTIYKIHTSGHADTETLKLLADTIKPKNIIPIHTFHGSKYKRIFTQTIVLLKDGEIKEI